jgi:hypothetical protein
MPQIKSSVNIAKKKDREKYKKALNLFLNNQSSQDDLQHLQKTLKNAAENARPTTNNNILLNRMQFSALLALEAEFFVAIESKITDENKEKYLDLYKKLFCNDSDFEKSMKLFLPIERILYEGSSLEYKDFDSMVAIPDIFTQKLSFTRNVKKIFAAKKNVELPKADIKTLKYFMLNIDPRIMAYVVACNSDDLKVHFTNFNKVEGVIDICHEYIIVSYAICCALVDTTVLLIPPVTLGLGIFHLGASLPITVGVGICAFGLELTHLNETNTSNKVFNPMTSNIINQHLQVSVQRFVDDSTKSITPDFIKQPIQFFDFIGMAKELKIFISNSYTKHKLDFSKQAPEYIESFDELMVVKYDSSRRSFAKADGHMIDEHLANLGIKIEHKVS